MTILLMPDKLQVMTLVRFFYILLIIILCSCAEQVIPKMLITKACGLIIVDVRVNGEVAYFLVDTGSFGTIIDSAYSTEKGWYQSNDNHKVGTLNGQGDLHEITSEINLSIKGYTLKKDRVYSTDLSKLIKSINGCTGIRICGIMGSDIANSNNYMIDYQNGKIYIK